MASQAKRPDGARLNYWLGSSVGIARPAVQELEWLVARLAESKQ